MDMDRSIGEAHRCHSKGIMHLKDDLTAPYEAILRKTDQLSYLMISETFLRSVFYLLREHDEDRFASAKSRNKKLHQGGAQIQKKKDR